MLNNSVEVKKKSLNPQTSTSLINGYDADTGETIYVLFGFVVSIAR
jgi:hypothetical protein